MLKAYSYIRFSTQEQSFGDSERRQIQATENFCQQNHLSLQTTTYSDLGISAFTKKTRPGLQSFLSAVQKGKIKKGSYLIIESLDRLSREPILDALNILQQVINSGISITTLKPSIQTYTKDNINDLSQLLQALLVLSRGYEESKIKSQRISAAWEAKRKNIDKKPLTARCPAWLTLKDDTFIIDKKKVKVISLIYDLYLKGNGVFTITKILNNKNIKTFSGKQLWQHSAVKRLLHNIAVIGQYEPHIMVDGKRTATGEIIENYFPPIINKKTFFQVQQIMQKKYIHSGPTTKKQSNNLFTSLLKCFYCGTSMDYINKGEGCIYLVCSKARRSNQCCSFSVPYKRFEKYVLDFIQPALDLTLSTPDISAYQTEKDDLEQRVKNLHQAIELYSGNHFQSFMQTVSKKIEALQNKIASLDQLIQQSLLTPIPITKNMSKQDIKKALLLQIKKIDIEIRGDKKDKLYILHIHNIFNDIPVYMIFQADQPEVTLTYPE